MTERFKVFISVDIEGITGIVNWKDTEKGKGDYTYFRKLMTQEANAAVEAALESGATDVFVRDAHGDALNILPGELHREARLIREWSGSPYGMMDGIDASFQACIFIGYHAKAHTPNATLKHTMSLKIADLRMNGISLAEAGFNALIAGYFDVPLVFISGDKAICDYAEQLWPKIETVAVKQGIGTACVSLHPEKTKEMIRAGVLRALGKRDAIAPFKVTPPFRLEVEYNAETSAYRAAWFPGVVRKNERTVIYNSDDFMDCLRFFLFCGFE